MGNAWGDSLDSPNPLAQPAAIDPSTYPLCQLR